MINRLLTAVLLGTFVLCATFAVSCGSGGERSAEATSPPPPASANAASAVPTPTAVVEGAAEPLGGQNAAPAASPATSLVPSGPPGEVVASVNGTPITRGSLDLAVRSVVRDTASVPGEKRAEVLRGVLDNLIRQELMYQKARAENAEATDAELAASISKLRAGFPDEAAFNAQLAKDGVEMKYLEAMLRQTVTIDKYLRSTIMPKITVSPQDETQFYEANKDKMGHPEQIRASHILLGVARDATPEQKQAARAKAEEVLAKVRKGEDFAILAKQYSQDPGSAAQGGDLGFFARGEMVKEFETSVWALADGELSSVVETPFGFHVIKRITVRPAGLRPLDEVRGEVRQYLTGQKMQVEVQKFSDSLRQSAKIEVKI